MVWTQHKQKILRRGGKNTQRIYKRDPNDPDNYDGVVTHLELDILKCEVKWALGSIIMNKASGGDGIPAELFQLLKDDGDKVLHSVCHQIWKISNGHRTGRDQISFQSQRKAIPKNVHTAMELCSFHILAHGVAKSWT